MSRAERRAYKRLTKNQDPYALPGGAGRGRAPRRPRGQRRAPSADGAFAFVSRRFLVWLLGGGAAIGLVAFSLAWPNGMPMALYIGLGAAAVWALLVVGFRLAQRRASRAR